MRTLGRRPPANGLLHEALTDDARTAWHQLDDHRRAEALVWIDRAWLRRTRRDRAQQVVRVLETRQPPASGLTQASTWETGVWGGLFGS